MAFTIQQLDHVALRVEDPERSSAWYQEVLGLEHVHPGLWGGVPVLLQAGEGQLALFRAAEPLTEPETATRQMLHVAFRTDRLGFESAQEELSQRGIEFEFQDHDICHSLYLRDPDGYLVEVTTYELGDEPPVER